MITRLGAVSWKTRTLPIFAPPETLQIPNNATSMNFVEIPNTAREHYEG